MPPLRKQRKRSPKKRHWERRVRKPAKQPSRLRRVLAALWFFLKTPFAPPPPPPRVVLDTNVLIGALMSKTHASYHILQLFFDDRIEIIVSPETLHEAKLVFGSHGGIRHYHRDGKAVTRLLEAIDEKAHWVKNTKVKYPICEDPTDDKFFTAAVAGNARYIVSNDRHLLRVGSYKGVKVLGTERFLETFLQIWPA